MLRLTLILQLLHSLDSLFDRDLGIHSVGVVQIYVRHTQPTQTFGAGFLDVLGRAVDGAASIGVDYNGELGGQEDVLSLAGIRLEPPPKQVFRVFVQVGAVPIALSPVVRMAEHRESLLVRFHCAVECTQT